MKDLSPVFNVLLLYYAGGNTLQTYFIYYEVVEVQDLFGVWKQTCKPLPPADLEMPVILELPWLQRNNSRVDFTNLTVQWRSDAGDSLTTLLLEENIIEGLIRKLEDLRVNYIMQGLQVTDSDEQEDSAMLIPEAYKSLVEVFLETQMEILPSHCKEDHSIDLLEGTTLPFKPIYNLFTKELAVLQKYLNINLTNEFIQPLQFSAEASVLFISKGDKGLQLCVNYYRLNAIM